MNTLWQDVKYGFRMLLKYRSTTIIAVVTLALGIGACASIFSFVNSILLRPLPFAEPGRLVALWETHQEKGNPFHTASTHNVADWAQRSRTMEQFAVWRDWGFRLRGESGPEPVYGSIASPNLFSMLRVKPALGRLFLEDEGTPGRDHVVLLSHRFWQRRFNSDPHIVGRSLVFNGEDFRVAGVLPPGFQSPSLGDQDVWAPHTIDPDLQHGRWLRNRSVYARLRPGATLEQARTEIAAIARQVAEEHPDTNKDWTVGLRPLLEDEVGSVREEFLLFSGAVGFVLLIACANVASLLLARAASRRREFSIRAALGARGSRLVRQLLTESLILSLAAGALGALFAVWAVDFFVAISPQTVPRLDEVRIDGTVLGFTVLVSLFAGLLFGLAPAFESMKVSLVESLKEGGRTGQGIGGTRLRDLLAGAEMALALILLIGAGLLLQSFVRLASVDMGFDSESLLTFQIFPGDTKYPTRDKVVGFYEQLSQELKTLPGVRAVGNVSAIPLFGGRENVEFAIEGQPAANRDEALAAYFHNASPGYFQAMGIPLLRGRDFNEHDNDRAPQVAIINETMARLSWPEQNPVGQRIRLTGQNAVVEVVGVVGDVREPVVGERAEPMIYFPYRQQARWASIFVLRTNVPPQSLISAVRARVATLDRDVVVSSVRTMQEQIARKRVEPRFHLLLMSLFAGIGLTLGLVGVYGVMANAVSQRTREIGVRMALGARAEDIFAMILRRGLRVTLAGIAVGLAAAFGMARYLESLLYSVHARDAVTFAAVAGLLALTSLLACWVPARRATRVDPMVALRYE